jgi:hypothetical protein
MQKLWETVPVFLSKQGSCAKYKKLITSLLLRNNGIRDIETVLGVSRGCVLNVLLTESRKCELRPKFSHYKTVQIDEFGSYVHQRKKQKSWLIYAYCPETKEVLGYVIGDRSIKSYFLNHHQIVLEFQKNKAYQIKR